MLLFIIYVILYLFIFFVFLFFFKQKTAYEMRISDWSSDVCSSDLADAGFCLESVPSLPGTALFWPADAGRNPFQECHLSRLYHPALYDRDVPVGSYWEASAPPLARDTPPLTGAADCEVAVIGDRKSTRLNSSH